MASQLGIEGTLYGSVAVQEHVYDVDVKEFRQDVLAPSVLD